MNGRVVQGGGLKTHYRKDARVRTPLRANFNKIIISNTNFIPNKKKFYLVKINYKLKQIQYTFFIFLSFELPLRALVP